MSPYELLGVSPGSTFAEIRAAYKNKVKQYHPDINASPNATDMLQQINGAYALLKSGIVPPAPASPQPRRSWSATPGSMKFYDFFTSGTDKLVIHTGVDRLPAGSVIFLMNKGGGQEIRVVLEDERPIPTTLAVTFPVSLTIKLEH